MLARWLLYPSALLGAVATTGCATQARLEVYSQPPGAYISEKGSGTVFGLAPTVIAYEASSLVKRADGCYYVKGLDAKWVSGASASLETIKLCGAPTGTYNITFSRSPNYPDLERDLQFALKLQSANTEQRKARAAEEAANAATYQAYKPSKPVTCTSTQIGRTVQTDCY